jgi:hypothetical protein
MWWMCFGMHCGIGVSAGQLEKSNDSPPSPLGAFSLLHIHLKYIELKDDIEFGDCISQMQR